MTEQKPEIPFTCPWWLIYFFDNPLRRLVQKPEEMFAGLIQCGDMVLDVGCGMGYFTLPMAEMAGKGGKVIAADLQKEMLAGLHRRAQKAGLQARIQYQLCEHNRIGIPEDLDFALAFWMVHEVRDQKGFLNEIYHHLKPGKQFLLVEPRIHVGEAAFNKTVDLAKSLGFQMVESRKVFFSRAVLLRK
jgi:ubiquinone/menaquinone biosynthesis C-methylase UbiE